MRKKIIAQCSELVTETLQVEFKIRAILKELKERAPVKGVMKFPELDVDSEVPANLMIAVRHLEDARNRITKAVGNLAY